MIIMMSIDDIVVMSILFIRVFFLKLHEYLLCILRRVMLDNKSGKVEVLVVVLCFGVGIPYTHQVATLAWH